MKKTMEIEQLPPCPSIIELENYRNKLKKLIGYKKIALSKSVEGRLRISSAHGVRQFYHVIDKRQLMGKYIPAENTKLVRQLAQKSYDKRLVSKMVQLEKSIRKFCVEVSRLVPECIFENLKEDRKLYVQPAVLPDKEFAKIWLSEEYHGKPFWDGDKSYFTAGGLRVRSKSEILIANTLERYAIPFRYEYPVELRYLGTVNPDFYVLRLSDRKEFCWEHFGIMDEPDYAEQAVRKLLAYEQSGWFPGKNMIVTFESSSHPLEERMLQYLLESYFC